MDTQLEERLQQALASYRRRRDNFLEAQQKLRSTNATVKSRDRLISVTVDARGQMTGLKFHSTRYRDLTEGELAKLIMDTMAKACEKVRGETRQVVAPLLPEDISFDQVADGTVPWDRHLAARPRVPGEAGRILAAASSDDGRG